MGQYKKIMELKHIFPYITLNDFNILNKCLTDKNFNLILDKPFVTDTYEKGIIFNQGYGSSYYINTSYISRLNSFIIDKMYEKIKRAAPNYYYINDEDYFYDYEKDIFDKKKYDDRWDGKIIYVKEDLFLSYVHVGGYTHLYVNDKDYNRIKNVEISSSNEQLSYQIKEIKDKTYLYIIHSTSDDYDVTFYLYDITNLLGIKRLKRKYIRVLGKIRSHRQNLLTYKYNNEDHYLYGVSGSYSAIYNSFNNKLNLKTSTEESIIYNILDILDVKDGKVFDLMVLDNKGYISTATVNTETGEQTTNIYQDEDKIINIVNWLNDFVLLFSKKGVYIYDKASKNIDLLITTYDYYVYFSGDEKNMIFINSNKSYIFTRDENLNYNVDYYFDPDFSSLTYSGENLETTLYLAVKDINGNFVSKNVICEIKSKNALFKINGENWLSLKTSADKYISIPIIITKPGYIDISVNIK